MIYNLKQFIENFATGNVCKISKKSGQVALLIENEKLTGNLEITLEKEAALSLYGLNKNEHNDLSFKLKIFQKNGSNLKIFWILENVQTANLDIQIEVLEKSLTALNTLVISKNTNHISVIKKISHLKNNSKSSQFSKVILDDFSTVNLSETIEVKEKTKDNQADLINKNLLVSKDTHLKTQPILKINSKDVACSHQSGTSLLEEEELFYLYSRGFTKTEATKLISSGFLKDFLEKIDLVCFKEKVDGNEK